MYKNDITSTKMSQQAQKCHIKCKHVFTSAKMSKQAQKYHNNL